MCETKIEKQEVHIMKLWFLGYGELEWIEATEYYAGDYRYVESSFCDEDGESYDIVYSEERMGYYCTRF